MAKNRFPYELAISFAEPDQQLAEGIGSLLAEKGVNVFYDRYEEAELWGKDLYDHLSTVYQQQACYCMILASKAYADRIWTNPERKSDQARACKEKKSYILPVRLDDTDIPGISHSVGDVLFKEKSVDDIATLFIQKLSLNRDAESGHRPVSLTKYRPSETEIMFYNSFGDDARPVCIVDVGESTELVLDAIWAGDYIELFLGSTSQGFQSELMYEVFFESYSYKNDFSKKRDIDGLEQAEWSYDMDVVLIGHDKIEAKIKELVAEHNKEILRIRKKNMSED